MKRKKIQETKREKRNYDLSNDLIASMLNANLTKQFQSYYVLEWF